MAKLLALLLSLQLIFASADPIQSQPQKLQSFAPKSIQTWGSTCSYSVVIKTSCSSASRTRDRVSIAFGDAYGNEVYAPRLDDPRSGTFEKCSTDTFQIRGPCTYSICYVYLLRVGSDGWKPESVKLYGQDRKAATYNYNTFLPNGVWYGFDHCKGGAAVSF
ncbi:embryo-specific protein ATS3A-like [Henckelia pumila]|uniref:embryo-specific protein ATS3A-like n=1 Tax=Henckelia pumila TaxID=405737 RepID=UPI003C6E647F